MVNKPISGKPISGVRAPLEFEIIAYPPFKISLYKELDDGVRREHIGWRLAACMVFGNMLWLDPNILHIMLSQKFFYKYYDWLILGYPFELNSVVDQILAFYIQQFATVEFLQTKYTKTDIVGGHRNKY